jgi:peptide/nickel transport system substrate-binding protein
MNKRPWMIFAVTLLLLAALLLPACSKSTTTSTATTSTTTKSTTTTTTATTLTPVSGGTLKIGHTSDVLSYYPPTNMRGNDLAQSRVCIEELARFNAKGELTPWLAESWTTDAAAKTITLTLKKGIKFQDGTDFDAAACKWNIDNFVTAKRSELPPLTSIDIIDTQTLKLTFVDWNNTALIGLLYFAGQQISPTAWQKAGTTDKERNDWATVNPVGTGPYKLVSRQRDVNEVFNRFDGYWKGKPYLDGITYVYIADPTVAEAAFKAGEIDAWYALPATQAKNLKDAGAIIAELTTGLGATQMTLAGSSAVEGSPFANLKVRQAISYAIDKKAIVDTLHYGWGITTNQWGIPTGQWANPNVKGYPYDPEKAKQLLAEAGYPTITTTLLTGDAADQIADATAVQGMLAKVGITATLDIAAAARKNNQDTTAGFEGLDIVYIRADTDLAMILPRYVGAKGSVLAKSITHPDAIEQLLVEAKQQPDYKTKQAKIWELQSAIFDQYCLVTSILVNVNLTAKKSYIHDDGLMVIQYDEWTPETIWMSPK